MGPDKTQNMPQKERRVVAAWRALRGDPVTPVSLRAEWCEVQLRILSVLDSVSAAAAKAYERDRAALKKASARIAELEGGLADPEPAVPAGGGWNPEKVALSRAWLAKKSGANASNSGEPHVDGP